MRAGIAWVGALLATALPLAGCAAGTSLVDREDVPSASELARHLVVAKDFGPGWELEAYDSDEDGAPDRRAGVITSEQRSRFDERLTLLPYFCPYGDTASQDVLWDAGTWLHQPHPSTEPRGPSVAELLVAAEPAQVEELFAGIRDVMSQCQIDHRDDYDPVLVPEYAGGYILKRGEVVDVLDVGDDRFAVRTLSAEAIPLKRAAVGGYGWTVLVREGPILAAIVLGERFGDYAFDGELPEPTTDVDAVVATVMERLGSDVPSSPPATTAPEPTSSAPSRPSPGVGSMTAPPAAEDLLSALLRPADVAGAGAGTSAEWYPTATTGPTVLPAGVWGGAEFFAGWACPGREHAVDGIATQVYTQLAGATDGVFDDTSVEVGEWLAAGDPDAIADAFAALRDEALACVGDVSDEGWRYRLDVLDVPAEPGEDVLAMTMRSEPPAGTAASESRFLLALKGPVLVTMVVAAGEPPLPDEDVRTLVRVALDALG